MHWHNRPIILYFQPVNVETRASASHQSRNNNRFPRGSVLAQAQASKAAAAEIIHHYIIRRREIQRRACAGESESSRDARKQPRDRLFIEEAPRCCTGREREKCASRELRFYRAREPFVCLFLIIWAFVRGGWENWWRKRWEMMRLTMSWELNVCLKDVVS